MNIACRSRGIVAAGLFLLTIVSIAQAKYSGGHGRAKRPVPDRPRRDPEDYGRHFILTADIDLDPDLPRRKVFDKAVIAPDTDAVKSGFQGAFFTGVFDGSAHTISHLTIQGNNQVGLFGRMAGEVRDLGVEDPDVMGLGDSVGILVGGNLSAVTGCYSTGAVSGDSVVGGPVGSSIYLDGDPGGVVGSVMRCYGTAPVRGKQSVGDRKNPKPGGTGRIYIDDIRLTQRMP